MRKNIAIFALALIISAPFVSIAETAPATLTADQKSVWDVLIVLITQLTGQVDALTAENTALRATCSQASTVPTTPTFGSISNNTPVQSSMQEISVETIKNDPNKVLPLGSFYFNVSVEKDGKPVSQEVSTQFPADHDTQSVYGGGSEVTTKQIVSKSIQFGPYIPTSAGTKTITFTSGSLSKSVTVEVR